MAGWAQKIRTGWSPITCPRRSLDLAFGRFEVLRYTVVDGDGEERYWFARALPGMPVRTEDWEAGELRSSMTMIEHIPGD